MSFHGEIHALAWMIAIVAGLNWVFGNRSIFGRILILRPGNFWRTTRWSGLVLFALAVTIQNQLDGHGIVAIMAIIGASAMLLGTARKHVQYAPVTQIQPTTEPPAATGQSE